MTVLRIMCDFDGCLSPGHIKIENDNFLIDGPILKDILLNCEAYKSMLTSVEVASFSNRQDFTADSNNSLGKPYISSYQGLAGLAQKLRNCLPKNIPVYLDQYLLTDSQYNLKPGATWQAAMRHISECTYPLSTKAIEKLASPLNLKANFDDTKLMMLYMQAQRSCARHPDEPVVCIIYDDREDILETIYKFTNANPLLFPHNFYLDLRAYTSIKDSMMDEYKMKCAQISPGASPHSADKFLPGGLPFDKTKWSTDPGMPEKYPYITTHPSMPAVMTPRMPAVMTSSEPEPSRVYFRADDKYRMLPSASLAISRGTAGQGECNLNWHKFYTPFHEATKLMINSAACTGFHDYFKQKLNPAGSTPPSLYGIKPITDQFRCVHDLLACAPEPKPGLFGGGVLSNEGFLLMDKVVGTFTLGRLQNADGDPAKVAKYSMFDDKNPFLREFSDGSNDPVPILDHARNIILDIKLFEKIKTPTISEQRELCNSLRKFAIKFYGGPISNPLDCRYPANISAATLAPVVSEINSFIVTPRDPKFCLKPEFYRELANPKLMRYMPETESFINAEILEDLLSSYILNVDNFQSCTGIDWIRGNTTSIEYPGGSSEFIHDPRLKDVQDAISKGASSASLLDFITSYCSRFGLNTNQINFIIAHANQNGALGSLLGVFGGKVLEKWLEWQERANLPFSLTIQQDICYKIITKPGQPLLLKGQTDFGIKDLSEKFDYVSQLCVSLEIGNDWRTLQGKKRSYEIPMFAKIKFSYTTPAPAAVVKYPEISDILHKTWIISRTRFASIEELEWTTKTVPVNKMLFSY
ncbi:MAG: hypothetical protein EXR81_02880 [Gammaproteobacteria bacterium]|nr:hypothetical protein [Gammaproteobacteria bacterium]